MALNLDSETEYNQVIKTINSMSSLERRTIIEITRNCDFGTMQVDGRKTKNINGNWIKLGGLVPSKTDNKPKYSHQQLSYLRRLPVMGRHLMIEIIHMIRVNSFICANGIIIKVKRERGLKNVTLMMTKKQFIQTSRCMAHPEI